MLWVGFGDGVGVGVILLDWDGSLDKGLWGVSAL